MGSLGVKWEKSRQMGQFQRPVPTGHPHSHWAFLDIAVGFLLGAGVCDTGVGAVPYQSWSRMSPWQMCRERELQTVEG